MWKFLCQSVEGTSHKQTTLGCQDSSFAGVHGTNLILAVADGAGSASLAADGSKLACATAVALMKSFFDSGKSAAEITADVLRGWMSGIHTILEAEATARAISSREMACTMLIGVVGESSAAFAQIGDGAIVILDEQSYRPVFWPATGEFHNTTYFVTETEFDKNIQLETFNRKIDELAMFSDGLEMLALNYSTRTAHGPFFAQLFRSLRAGNSEELAEPMRQFLDSKAINDRTDDDKTLILATRHAEPTL
jgi:hypothetical protein